MVLNKKRPDAADNNSPQIDPAIQKMAQQQQLGNGNGNGNGNNSTLTVQSETQPTPLPRKKRGKIRGMKLSERVKTFLFAIALGVLPVAAIGTVAGFVAQRSVTQEVAATEEKRAKNIAEQLNAFLAERYGDVESLAAQLVASNPTPAPTAPNQQQILAQFLANSPYEGVVIFNSNGQPILQTPGSASGNIKDRADFKTVLTENRSASILEDSLLWVSAPVRESSTGRTVAVVSARLPLAQAEFLMQGDDRAWGETYALFNGAGTVVLSDSETPQPIAEQLPELATQSNADTLISPGLKNGMALLRSIGRSETLDREYLASVAPTTSGEGEGLEGGVVVAADPQEVISAQQNRVTWIALATLGIAAFCSAIALWLAKRTARPIQERVRELEGKLNTLEEKNNLSAARSQRLNEIVADIRPLLKQEEILNTTVSELRYALNTDRVIVYRFHDDWNGTIIAESVATGWKKILGETVQDPFREGLIERYRNGRVRSMDDIYGEGLTDCHKDILEGFQIRASIVAPIIHEDRLMGLLCAHECAKARNWAEEDVEFFKQFSSQLGFILERAALLQQQTRSAERSRLLNDLVASMRRSLQEEEILNTTVSELRYALNTDRVIVYRFHDDWNGTIIAESVAAGWKKILGETVQDPFREGLIERYRNGRVRSMDDIYGEGLTDCHKDILEGFQIRASIVAPIIQNEKLIGLLCAHECSNAREWEEEDVDLFAKLATQLGFALDQAALLRKQTRSAARSRLLNELVASMRRSLQEEEILNITVSELRYALNTDRAIVYRFHDDWNGTIIAESVAAGWKKILGETVQDPFREGLIERYRNGRVRSMNDIYGEGLTDCHKDILEGFQIRASIVAPIIQNEKLIGLLCAHECSNAREWEEEDVDLFAKLATQLGFALDQAALLRKQTLSAERLLRANELVASMRRSLQEEEILNTAVSELRYALNTDRVIVYRFHDDWNGTIIAESVAAGWHKILGETVQDPFREGLIERYRNGRVRSMNDIYDEGLTDCHKDILEGFQIRASIVAPIIQNEKLIGLLCAHECSNAREWGEEDINLFAHLATQLGFALDQAALLEYTERARQEARAEADAKTEEQRLSARQAQTIKDITLRIIQSLKLESILKIAVDDIRNVLQADRVLVYRFNKDWVGTVIEESVDSAWPKALGEQIKDPCFAKEYVKKYQRGRVQAIADIREANLTDCHIQQLETFEVKANLVAPILVSGQLLGLLIAHQCSGVRDWQPTEVEMFAQLASQVGFALDRAFLLKQAEAARKKAEALSTEQRQQKEFLQQRALDLLMEVEPVSQGDLTVRANVTADEIGTVADSYNAILRSLRQIVGQVQEAALSVTQTAQGNEESVKQVAVEALQQASAIAEALEQIQIVAQTSEGVALRAKQAAQKVKLADRVVKAGDAAMNRTVSGISTIRETVSETAKKVKRLGEASQKISKVVNLIGDFAAQTNLLALNAAIEAARAGEEGMGFSVVAEEIRALAQQSTNATTEIEQLVEEIQTQTNEVVSAMEAGTEQVVAGTQLVEDSRQKLNQISNVSSQVNQIIQEIAQAATEQTDVSATVSHRIQDVAAIATKTSKQSEDVASSFSHLLEVAQELQVSVAKFKVN
ncbi:GAF domain-containing protein [Lusitaniella coriacea]|uniref:GAF domain-containing protein n=1 Tax=Lusitaniella coriacea TaxID=1983105 RepID=UPI003CF13658